MVYCVPRDLGRRLGVSRAAVWKAIDSLRRDGYVVEARTGLGYRLTASPDALVEREIRRRLSPLESGRGPFSAS